MHRHFKNNKTASNSFRMDANLHFTIVDLRLFYMAEFDLQFIQSETKRNDSKTTIKNKQKSDI